MLNEPYQTLKAQFLMWSVTLSGVLADDAAMLALLFC